MSTKSSIRVLILSFLFLLNLMNIQSQVTIGSGGVPMSGALLDLKEVENTEETLGKANSTRGLLLPRVRLTAFENLSDIATSGDESVESYMGLTVYNTRPISELCDADYIPSGLYVWDGTKWIELVSKSNGEDKNVIVDSRDNNRYLYRSFGNAGEWMVENLRFVDPSFGFSQAGDSENNLRRIFYPQVEGGAVTDTASISTWSNSHGVLYTYSAATNGIRDGEVSNLGNNTTRDALVIGICPEGWHIPSDYEWSRLEEEIAKYSEKYSYSTFSMPWEESYNSAMGDRPDNVAEAHGTAMKFICPLPETSNITNGTGFAYNKGGFGALLLGSASAGLAQSYGSTSLFMSGSTYSANNIYGRRLYSDNAKVGRVDVDRKELMSVRCKKNEKPTLINSATSVPLSNQIFTITTSPLELKGGTLRWISGATVTPVDNRRGKLSVRLPGIYNIQYELTTDEGDVLIGYIEVVVYNK